MTLPGAVALVSLALRVADTHKLLHHGKAEVQQSPLETFGHPRTVVDLNILPVFKHWRRSYALYNF